MSTLSRLLNALLWIALLAPAARSQPDRLVHEVVSEFQRISVWDTSNGHRQLIFDGRFDGTDAIQSEMNLARPTELTLDYSQHMMTALPLAARRDRILVIGLGGACIQRYLHDLLTTSTIETAELDPVVRDVARRYFNLREDQRQRVHIGDGRKFIEQSRDKYDVIILDAFSATSIPYALSTQEFLIAVKDRLTSGGLVCANLWNEVAEYNDMLKTYDSVFPEWLLLRCGDSGNVILLAFPARMNLTPERWTGIAASFNRSYRTGLDLAGMIRRGVVRRPRIAPRAKVLLDAGTTTSTQTMPSRIPVAN